MIKLSHNRKKITYDTYVNRGNVILLREALEIDDPDNLYNYLANSEALKIHGFTPEDFGIESPIAIQYKNLTRNQLILKIEKLTKTIEYLKLQIINNGF